MTTHPSIATELPPMDEVIATFNAHVAKVLDTEARLAAAEALLTYSQGLWYDGDWWSPATEANIRDALYDATDLLLSVGVRP